MCLRSRMHRLFALLRTAVVQHVARQLRMVRRATDDVVRQEGRARVWHPRDIV